MKSRSFIQNELLTPAGLQGEHVFDMATACVCFMLYAPQNSVLCVTATPHPAWSPKEHKFISTLHDGPEVLELETPNRV